MAATKVLASVEHGQTMNVQTISATKFKVTHGMKYYTVDLVGRKCSYQEFHIDLIHCPHTAVAIGYYITENLREMYSGEVMKIAHPDNWDVPLEVSSRVVLPPHNLRQAGCSRTNRMSIGSRSLSRGR
ncbi:hypothetical protein C2S53_002041 [Perilla frutescens var. hirtella]|uniref:SWIM-type domain-containing protein n=1 Tax=Perilla frutescens var. hirtella TaxID=608512 RepID=A0AAD4P1W7_PERFH|nr:hypothetical protein C2S53_002041 [Perilla frutescens var. hirtella]